MQETPITIIYSFHEGPKIEIKGYSLDSFQVLFINQDTNKIEYSAQVQSPAVVTLPMKYFVRWRVIVKTAFCTIFDYTLSLKGRRVFINPSTYALGDILAWLPYFEEFRKRHECELFVYSIYRNLFSKSYPNIRFPAHNEPVPDVFLSYKVGCTPMGDRMLSPRDWNKGSLQGIARDLLGLSDLGEIKPKLDWSEDNDIHADENNLICIATEASMLCKIWQRNDGWDKLCAWIISKGYNIVNLSVIGIEIDGVHNVDDHEPLESIMSYLKHAKLFIGGPSGLSWLAWALNVPVVMISGFSEPYSEFSDKVHVGPPEGKCHGCFNRCPLGLAWDWCPDHKNFECTKSITFSMVRDKIKHLI